MNPSNQEPLKIIELDDEGWAAFKTLEAQHRRDYAASAEAVADHQAWINAPMAKDGDWGSIPLKEREDLEWPEIIPSPTEIPWPQLYDWSQEKFRSLSNA